MSDFKVWHEPKDESRSVIEETGLTYHRCLVAHITSIESANGVGQQLVLPCPPYRFRPLRWIAVHPWVDHWETDTFGLGSGRCYFLGTRLSGSRIPQWFWVARVSLRGMNGKHNHHVKRDMLWAEGKGALFQKFGKFCRVGNSMGGVKLERKIGSLM